MSLTWDRPRLKTHAALRTVDSEVHTVPSAQVIASGGAVVATFAPDDAEVRGQTADLLTHHVVSLACAEVERTDALMRGVEEGLGPLFGSGAGTPNAASGGAWGSRFADALFASLGWLWLPALLLFFAGGLKLDRWAERTQEEALSAYVLAEATEAGEYLKQWRAPQGGEVSLGHHFLRVRPPVPNATADRFSSAWSSSLVDGVLYARTQSIVARASSGFGYVYCTAPVGPGRIPKPSDVSCTQDGSRVLSAEDFRKIVPGDLPKFASGVHLRDDMTAPLEHPAQWVPYLTALLQLSLALLYCLVFVLPIRSIPGRPNDEQTIFYEWWRARKHARKARRKRREARMRGEPEFGRPVADLPLQVVHDLAWRASEKEGFLEAVAKVSIKTASGNVLRSFQAQAAEADPEAAYQEGLKMGRTAARFVEQVHQEAAQVSQLLAHAERSFLPAVRGGLDGR